MKTLATLALGAILLLTLANTAAGFVKTNITNRITTLK